MIVNSSKNQILKCLTLIFFCLSLILFSQEKKNLLFIITDQQQYKALRIAGNKVLQTPIMIRLIFTTKSQ